MTSHYTQTSVTALHDFRGVLGRRLDTILLSSHNFTVTALGSVCEVALKVIVAMAHRIPAVFDEVGVVLRV
jgi:hypothetical protein